MPLVTLRPKGQLTIPVHILQQCNLEPYEQLEVNLQNGVITMTPARKKQTPKKNQLMAFAGAGHGLWGETPEEVEKSIDELRDSWTR